MNPLYMKTHAIDGILGDFATHQRHYLKNDKAWFEQYLKDVDGLEETRFEFPDFFLSTGDGTSASCNYSATDCANIRTIYTAMRSLPEAVAADQRFWIGLCHTEFWDYVQFRNQKKLKKAKKEADVKAVYFWLNGSKRSAHINSLSRLWWAGHMTYDALHASDPFWLTNVLAGESFASRLVIMSSSNLTSNKDICLGVLEAIKEARDTGDSIKREHFVYATKYLNQMGSMTVLDCLSREYVRDLISAQFKTKAFAKFKLS